MTDRLCHECGGTGTIVLVPSHIWKNAKYTLEQKMRHAIKEPCMECQGQGLIEIDAPRKVINQLIHEF